MVDKDGNEMYFGETGGECQNRCKENNITGDNGEYIAEGFFDEEDRYFEIEDYEEINPNFWGKIFFQIKCINKIILFIQI